MIVRELLPVPRMVDEVQGLFRYPKSLPPKLFYDDAGSALFEQITELPEYYLTRTETAILQSFAHVIARNVGSVATVVELGAATSRKTRIIIAALLRHHPGFSFFPVDISIAPLRAGQIAMQREFPRLRQATVRADFVEDLSFLKRLPSPRLVLYLGSSIGNFDPMPAAAFLSRVKHVLQPGDALLVGTDMRKNPEILVPAYNDSKGITAAFNKNILTRINRELGGHFDLSRFRHLARWNDHESRMEIYLESTERQSVRVDLLGATIEFQKGELIHTENSYKYTVAMVATMLANAGFALEKTWTDEKGWFADHLARVAR